MKETIGLSKGQTQEATAARSNTGIATAEELRDYILSEREKGNVVFHGLPGQLMSAPLEEFVKQPADGILYDLNRLEEIALTFIDDPKWVNDFAVALVIRKLVAQRNAKVEAPEPEGQR